MELWGCPLLTSRDSLLPDLPADLVEVKSEKNVLNSLMEIARHCFTKAPRLVELEREIEARAPGTMRLSPIGLVPPSAVRPIKVLRLAN